MEVKDIKNLANLSRLEISDEEAEGLLGDLKSIIGYIDQIQSAPLSGTDIGAPTHRNVTHEDIVTTKNGEYTQALLAQAVDTVDGFVKVKKIL